MPNKCTAISAEPHSSWPPVTPPGFLAPQVWEHEQLARPSFNFGRRIQSRVPPSASRFVAEQGAQYLKQSILSFFDEDDLKPCALFESPSFSWFAMGESHNSAFQDLGPLPSPPRAEGLRHQPVNQSKTHALVSHSFLQQVWMSSTFYFSTALQDRPTQNSNTLFQRTRLAGCHLAYTSLTQNG